MLPTKRLAFVMGLAALVAWAASTMAELRLPVLAFDGLVVVMAALDVVGVLGRGVSAERHTDSIFSLGRRNPVRLKLRNDRRRTLHAIVADDPISDAGDEGLPAAVKLPPRGTAELTYQVTPTRRGRRAFGKIRVRYPSWLGLVLRQETIDYETSVDVFPDVHAARALELLRRQGRADPRLGTLRVRGGDTEFERLRPYQRGDEPRHVDWRATARRDELTVREFQAESNQNIVFAVDVGRAMRTEEDGVSLVDHALNAALLTADVALRAGDRAGFLAFDDLPRRYLNPVRGRSGGQVLTRTVYDLEPSATATDYLASAAFLRSRMRARSLIVLFTQLLEPRSARDLIGAVRALHPRHLALCVLLRDAAIEAMTLERARTRRDLYRRAAAAESLLWRESITKRLQRAGVLVLDCATDQLTPALMQRYLDIKARRLL